jgi:protein subunit release factor A
MPLINHIKAHKTEKDLRDQTLFDFNNEVVDAMKKILGVEAYNDAYLQYEQERKEVKEKLRIRNVQKSIVDPVQFAKDKMQENRDKFERRKRKIKEGVAPRKKTKKNPKSK